MPATSEPHGHSNGVQEKGLRVEEGSSNVSAIDEKISYQDGAGFISDSDSSASAGAVYDAKKIDPVLARKMALVNMAIDEIGMSKFQWNLLLLNGFGYAVDSVRFLTPLPDKPILNPENGLPLNQSSY